MHKSILLLFLFFFLGKHTIQACSCVYIPTFCETLSYSDSIFHDLIIYGTVTNIKNNGMEVMVVERLFGVENRSSIFIKKGNGADCGENTDQFRRGQNLILALQEVYNPDNKNEDRYWLSICGINYLEVENGNVKGPIAPGIAYISYEKFKRTTTCDAFEGFNPEVVGAPEFKVYPNPAKDQLFVEVGETIKSFDFSLSDTQGRVLLRGIRKEPEAESQITIDLPIEQLSTGLYFFRISSELGSKTVKVMIKAY